MTSILLITCLAISGCSHKQAAAPPQAIPQANTQQMQINFDIAEQDGFTVIGTVTTVKIGTDNSEKFTGIWKNFEQYKDQLKPLSANKKYYGVSFGTKKNDVIEYLAGMKVSDDAKSPDKNLVIRKVPAARYAVFKCPGKDVGQTCQYIFGQWLPGSRYNLDTNGCSFELYPPDEWVTRTVAIYVPVINK